MNWFSKGYKETLHQLRRKRRRDLFTFLFVWFLIPLLAVFILIFTCRSYRRSMIMRLEVMQLEKVELQGEHEDLTRIIADLSSRKRICDYATKKLGMRYPEQDEIVLVVFDGDDGSVTEGEVGNDGATVSSTREMGRGRSSINVLTHFFALYVF